MLVREGRKKPHSWDAARQGVPHRWLQPLYAIEWGLDWSAYFLSRWAFLEVLEYLGVLSIVVAAVFYFTEAGDRLKLKHYQAWQVINTAQGKGGNGGRIDALQELNADKVELVGVDLSSAFLFGVQLPNANLARAYLQACDLRQAHLQQSVLSDAELRSANLRSADLTGANLERADMAECDLVGAVLSGAHLRGSDLTNADLRGADLASIDWAAIRAIAGANIAGVRNAPAGFVDWAMRHGAVATRLKDE
jgi:hypothetical protein